jgi:hypothetical protein
MHILDQHIACGEQILIPFPFDYRRIVAYPADD